MSSYQYFSGNDGSIWRGNRCDDTQKHASTSKDCSSEKTDQRNSPQNYLSQENTRIVSQEVYPRVYIKVNGKLLIQEDAVSFHNEILKSISSYDVGIHFLHCTTKADCIIVTCANEQSRDWLDKQIPTLEPWDNADKSKIKLTIINESDLIAETNKKALDEDNLDPHHLQNRWNNPEMFEPEPKRKKLYESASYEISLINTMPIDTIITNRPESFQVAELNQNCLEPNMEPSRKKGGGMVEHQAPSPLPGTGIESSCEALTTSSPSSMMHVPDETKSGKRKRKRLEAIKRAEEQATTVVTAASTTNTSNVVMDIGEGQTKGVPLTPTDSQLAKKQRRRLRRNERRKQEVALFNEIRRHQLEGTFCLPGVSVLAPVVSAATNNIAMTSLPTTAAVSQQTLKCQTHPAIPEMPRIAIKLEPGVIKQETPILTIPEKGKDPSNHPAIASTISENRVSDCLQSSKRKRSSDIVSLPLAAEVKKELVESGHSASNAETGVDHVSSSDGRANTHAKADKTQLQVVILDKSGLHMDSQRSTALRLRLEQCTIDYYLAHKHDEENHNPPTFASMPILANGGLRVEACNEFSLSWLDSTIKNLPGLWPGSGGYKLIQEQDIPKYFKGVVYVPDFEGTAESIRDLLAFSNRHVRIRTWPIISHHIWQKENTKNHFMVFGIPVEEKEALEKTEYRLSYKMATVSVHTQANRLAETAESRVR